MILDAWARRWRLPPQAVHELRAELLGLDGTPGAVPGRSEAAVQAAVRIEASRKGLRLWRNNVGAVTTAEGRLIRFGLANDSVAVNSALKSGDLIGIRPRVIEPGDVGCLIGQFVSREVKHSGWQYTGAEREVAQANWAALIQSLGGDACFCSSEGSL